MGRFPEYDDATFSFHDQDYSTKDVDHLQNKICIRIQSNAFCPSLGAAQVGRSAQLYEKKGKKKNIYIQYIS